MTVVLLHPLALSGRVWGAFADALPGPVRTPDARGHGESTWDGRPFTVDDMAADVAAGLDGPVDVVGMSMGASTALVLAASRPDLVRRLILADGTACYGEDRVPVWAQRAERATTPRTDQLRFQRDRWFSEAFRRDHPAEVDRVARIFLATDSAAHAAACLALGGLDARERLGEVKAETLVLVGDEDYATPPAMAEELADGIPSATLRVLANTRHLSLLQRPDIWPDLVGFLNGQSVEA